MVWCAPPRRRSIPAATKSRPRSATTLYGATIESSSAGFYTMNITTAGATITDVVGGLSGGAMTLADGRLYTEGGMVIDPVAG